MKFELKSEDEIEKMSLKELADYRKAERADEIEKAIAALKEENAKDTAAKIADLTSKVAARDEKIEKLIQENITFGLKMKSISEKAHTIGEGNTLADQLKANVEVLKEISKRSSAAEVVVKANVLTTAVTGNTQAQDIPGIGQMATRKLTMYDLFPKIGMGNNNNGTVRYWDWDEASVVRAAALRAEGVAFPESTAVWQEYTLPLKKIGDTIPVSEEMFEDEVMFANELNQFLNTNVALVIDDEICNGAGGASLTGLFQSTPAFNAALVSDVPYANFYDLLAVATEQITVTGGAKYRPDFVVMRKSDINRMRLTKDANQNYIIPPFVSRDGMNVDGMVVIESNVVPSNSLVLGDSRYAKIYEKGGITLSKGEINAQFTSDMMTLKARKRLLFLIRTADQDGFVKITNITTAIASINLAS
jgi:HK97 family phage major capsid protein